MPCKALRHGSHSFFNLQITQCMPFLRKHSPDGVTPNWGSRHPIATYYSFIDPKGMKGWVGLVGWPIADGLPRLSARRGRSPAKTDVIPLCHAASFGLWLETFDISLIKLVSIFKRKLTGCCLTNVAELVLGQSQRSPGWLESWVSVSYP